MNFLKKTLPYLIFIATLLLLHSFDNSLNSITSNIYYLTKGTRPASKEIVIIVIDDMAINQEGQWKRDLFAELIDSISSCNPSIIATNIYFSPGQTKLNSQENTQLLSNAIKKSGKVMLPFYFDITDNFDDEILIDIPPAYIKNSSISKIIGKLEDIPLYTAKKLLSSEPSLAKYSVNSGFNNFTKPNYITLNAISYGNDLYLSFPYQVVSYHKAILKSQKKINLINSTIHLENTIIKTEDEFTSIINFLGPEPGFRVISATEPINNKNFNKSLLENKIVLFGFTGKKTSTESSTTPYGTNITRIELWATITDNILNNNFINTPHWLHLFYLSLLLLFLFIFPKIIANQTTRKAIIFSLIPIPFLFVLGIFFFMLNYFISIYLFVIAPTLSVLIWFILQKLIGEKNLYSENINNMDFTICFSPKGKLMQVGKYEILEEIGSGAMGIVYKANDTTINRLVAIKTLKTSISLSGNEDLKKRFLREAHSAGKLSHSNIVTIFDYGDNTDLSFIVMEYLDGTELLDIIKKEKFLSPKKTMSILKQIAFGLDYAHKANIIHRDIKPSNIMILKEEDQVKIMDFGIAKTLESDMTQDGKTLGTPNYMSPEQISGEEITYRTDLFSLAILTYEMLCGKRPFTGETLSALSFEITNKQAPLINEINKEIPEECAKIIKYALAKNPKERYETATDFYKRVLISLDIKE